MTGKTAVNLHAIVMAVLAFSLLSITAPDVQAKNKRKAQYCPQDEVMVGINKKGRIVCEQLEYLPPPLTERYVFLSSTTHTGNMGGIAGADWQCNKLAILSGIYRGLPFKAWLSDDNHSPGADFVKSEVPYKLVDGTLVADNWEDLTTLGIENNYLDTPINQNENGEIIPYDEGFDVLVFTNTSTAGFPNNNSEDCNNWVSDNLEENAGVGNRHNYKDEHWTFHTLVSCQSLGRTTIRLYCFEQ